ncbi:6861b8f9-1889-4e87-aade-2baf21d00ca4 [Sclerotinia trifoliorum]|uniref:6861b8f9-1889-4e87-aade-2baf21d00ca4 n=1 Tax=Sclerotinia trifoliorum TaxID=28548 RepID=A0A8H2ZRN7_9HELO|nr:6861b8f9-1889-4e87-aade-2baf21d00ca4 [Sclerotinia trifoliorum]
MSRLLHTETIALTAAGQESNDIYERRYVASYLSPRIYSNLGPWYLKGGPANFTAGLFFHEIVDIVQLRGLTTEKDEFLKVLYGNFLPAATIQNIPH